MYAVFLFGGKQYRVNTGKIIKVEKIDKKLGDQIQFDQILIIVKNKNIQFGQPYVKNSFIKAVIIAQSRSKKINIIKFRRRKHYKKQQGHRQFFTKIKIQEISN